jgi:hypothetical protein
MFWDIIKETLPGLILLIVPAVWVLMKYPFKRKPTDQPINRSVLDLSIDIFAQRQPEPEPEPAPIWGFLQHVPLCRQWAWSHIHTPARISSRIRMQVNGGESGIRFYWSAEASTASVSLYIVNLNPFPIVIDRIVGDLIVANSAVAPVSYLNRKNVDRVVDDGIFFEVPISEQQSRRIGSLRKHSSHAGVNLTLYITTPIREVEHRVHLKTSNTEFTNYHLLNSS